MSRFYTNDDFNNRKFFNVNIYKFLSNIERLHVHTTAPVLSTIVSMFFERIPPLYIQQKLESYCWNINYIVTEIS